jgi:hypothetical protein
VTDDARNAFVADLALLVSVLRLEYPNKTTKELAVMALREMHQARVAAQQADDRKEGDDESGNV